VAWPSVWGWILDIAYQDTLDIIPPTSAGAIRYVTDYWWYAEHSVYRLSNTSSITTRLHLGERISMSRYVSFAGLPAHHLLCHTTFKDETTCFGAPLGEGSASYPYSSLFSIPIEVNLLAFSLKIAHRVRYCFMQAGFVSARLVTHHIPVSTSH